MDLKYLIFKNTFLSTKFSIFLIYFPPLGVGLLSYREESLEFLAKRAFIFSLISNRFNNKEILFIGRFNAQTHSRTCELSDNLCFD